jgi:hypothetical protein
MKSIEQLVNETMESLEGVQQAPANPFLYTRIEQRLKSRQEYSYQRKLMPVLAIALVLFISLNVLSYLKVNNEPASVKNTGSGIENFANEYNLSEEGGL